MGHSIDGGLRLTFVERFAGDDAFVGTKREPGDAQGRLAPSSLKQCDDHAAREDGAVAMSTVYRRNDEGL